MKKFFKSHLPSALLALGMVLPGLVHSQSTDEQIARAKAAGAEAAAAQRGQTLVRDENGNIVYDENGRPRVQSESMDSRRADGARVSGYFGVTGIEQKQAPVGGSEAAGIATVSTSASVDFQCRTGLNKPYQAAGYVFRPEVCNQASGAVESVLLAVCDGYTRGATCAAPTSYNRKVLVRAGAFTALSSSAEVGLGCNSVGACRLSVSADQTIGGRADELAQASAEKAAESDSLSSDLRKATEEGDMAARTREMGAMLQACADQNRQSYAANGTVMTCDGSATVAASGTNASCQGEKRCVEESRTVQTFTRSCVRSNPTFYRDTVTSFGKTLECRLSRSAAGELTDSCTPAERDGLELAASTSKACSDSQVAGSDSVCDVDSWTEFLVGERNVVVASESGPGGALTCDTRNDSDTTIRRCEGPVFGRTLSTAECVVINPDDPTDTYQLSEDERPGCGVCTASRVSNLCHNPGGRSDAGDSCSGMDLQGCTLSSATPLTYTTSTGGLAAEQLEKYKCVRENTICLRYSRGEGESCSEPGDVVFGASDTPQSASSDGSLYSAIVAAAIIEETGKSAEGVQDQVIPLIFGGDSQSCRRGRSLGSALQRNCCDMGMERPKKGQAGIQRGCTMDDVELAAARRSAYTTYIGSYCSKRGPRPVRKCLEETETYCAFQGKLARLVQEQGREQLTQIVASGNGAASQTAPLRFGYYHESAGGWTPAVSVNGVQVAAWRWPAYCSKASSQADAWLDNPAARDCPTIVSTWFAACESEGGCGALPNEPYDGSEGWKLQPLNPLANVSTALSRLSVVSGACDPTSQSCAFNVSALPAASGGKTRVTRDLSWPLYQNIALDPNQPPPQVYQLNNIDDLMFRGYSVPGMSDSRTTPSEVRVDFSRDGGQTWTTYQVPTDLRNSEFQFPGSDVTMFGSCDALTNMCAFRMTGTTEIFAKPWGSAKAPDCSGFTAGQLSALDFSRMDLSEWLAEVMADVSTPDTAALTAQAQDQVRAFNEVFASGGTVAQTASVPTSGTFARVLPAEGFGPFDAKLAVSGFWPATTGDPARDTDKVLRVDVDWGDCTGIDSLAPLSGAGGGVGFSGAHRYPAPVEGVCGERNPATQNLKHTLKLTVYTSKSGVQHRTLEIVNVFSRFEGGGRNNDSVNTTTTVPAASAVGR